MSCWPYIVACFCLLSTQASHHEVLGKLDASIMQRRHIPCASVKESCFMAASRLDERLVLMRNVFKDHVVTCKERETSSTCVEPRDGTSTPGFNSDEDHDDESADWRGLMRLRGGAKGRRGRGGGKRKGGYTRRKETYLRILRYERDQEEGKIRAPIIGEDGQEEEVMPRHTRMQTCMQRKTVLLRMPGLSLVFLVKQDSLQKCMHA
jgi:hypothetical protein